MSKSQIRYLKWKNIFQTNLNQAIRPEYDNNSLNRYHLKSLKSVFNFKYYFSNNLNPKNKLCNFFYNNYVEEAHQNDFDDKLQELFEYKDKSLYFTASLVSRDITELNSVDNYKENFPFTVRT